jgi:hypothetical protein
VLPPLGGKQLEKVKGHCFRAFYAVRSGEAVSTVVAANQPDGYLAQCPMLRHSQAPPSISKRNDPRPILETPWTQSVRPQG